ncbi:endonuclease I family protein [Botrimarina hoheduenensis]|uniref:Extracellular ribonuclease n=1 Tax=Botrimarina hoheduenensis TaxID=2528000 RepID=A0A5C5W9L1_9BACT|nr:endonuclease [Botrimarina hoheduenensis]TWT46719.1 Extracellular ribonuclease precursor [Botrimarina hoheduenensis]
MHFFRAALSLAVLLFVGNGWANDVDFLPPPSYYAGATGTGAALKSQLQSITSTGHIQRTYGDFRNSAIIHDADPNNPGNILLTYNRASVSGTWDSGSTWNREHVWPQSLQTGSANNSSVGNLGDPHSLRPSNPSINTSRGNDPFGLVNTTGSFGAVAGGYYYPGDADAGDLARSLFYSATRYSGLTLVNGQPGSNQMGDLASLVQWHYRDEPDTFERRRNQAVYSSGLNPSYYTNNRNPYVDHPEFVWSVFVDNQNDSQVTLAGGSASADGSSVLALDFGRVYVGQPTPTLTQSITLDKGGSDGTYFQVTTAGAATSSLTGRHNAFRNGGTDTRTFDVGITANTALPGIASGVVTIDNLDITTGAGVGRGAQDGNDLIAMSLAVLSHPVASFSTAMETRAATIDFGQVALGDSVAGIELAIANLGVGSGGSLFAADLDLDTILGLGDTAAFSLGLSAFSGLSQGAASLASASLMTSMAGVFEATYTLALSGEDLAGEQMQTLALTLRGEVIDAAIQPGDFTGDGAVDNFDLNLLLLNWGAPTSPLPLGWNGDPPIGGSVDNDELNAMLLNWGAGTSSVAVPEPTGLVLVALLGGLLSPCRRVPRS